MSYYVGIDVGTTNIKAAAYTLDGEQHGFVSVGNTIRNPRPEWSEFDAHIIWQCVCDCLHPLAERLGRENIRAVGVGSMAECGVPLDERGRPVYPIIAWYDQRAQGQARELLARLDRGRLYRITGQVPSEKYGVSKMMWLWQNEPEVRERTRHWLSVEDYVLYRLTGEFATDYSMATRTMLFDIGGLRWCGEIAAAAGLPTDVLPKAYPAGTAVGALTAQAAAETGLGRATVAVTGGHDHACAAIGVDILGEGVVLDSMGTAECSMIAVAEPALDDRTLSAYTSVYPHCGRKLYRVLSSIQSCGASVEWLMDTAGQGMAQQAARDKVSRYRVMEEAAAASKQDGLYFLPFLRGSIENMKLSGTFLGLKSSHVPGDLARAVMDSLCYELRQHLDNYERIFSLRPETVRAVGGLSKSDYFLQHKADLTGVRVEAPAHMQAVCFGAAILAAIGSGAADFSALPELHRRRKLYLPQGEPDAASGDYRRYLALRRELKAVYDRCY